MFNVQNMVQMVWFSLMYLVQNVAEQNKLIACYCDCIC
jgi:hypothetical protein